MKIADELKECAAMTKLAQEEVVGLQMWAQSTERELQAVSESIESLPNLKDIDVLNRRHCLCQRIRKGISDIIHTIDHSGIASEAFKKEWVTWNIRSKVLSGRWKRKPKIIDLEK